MQYMVQAEVWCEVLLSSLLWQSLPLLVKFPEQPEFLINPNVAMYYLIGLNLAFFIHKMASLLLHTSCSQILGSLWPTDLTF